VKSLFAVALGLVLLIEGIFPFLFPRQWCDAINRIAQLTDGQIRFVGLVALTSGLVILGLVHIFS